MKILIIDNYDSFTFNLYQIAKKVCDNVDVYRNDKITLEQVTRKKYSHIIISPGAGSPDDERYFGVCKKIIKAFKDTPILGVCLGHQGIISCFGGKIIQAQNIRHGKQSIISHNSQGIFRDIKNNILGMRYHSLVADRGTLPNCLTITAESVDDHAIMAISHNSRPLYGVQFHPESIGTQSGDIIIKNFLTISK